MKQLFGEKNDCTYFPTIQKGNFVKNVGENGKLLIVHDWFV